MYEAVSEGGSNMNKRTLIVLPISLALAACTSVDPLSGLKCSAETGPVPPCKGDPHNPEVTINTNSWVIAPRCVKANKTSTITFKVVPAADNPLGSTAILPKNVKDTWLIGTNAPESDEISIEVPDWVTMGDHSYGVVKSNGDCLDPRVHVVDE